MLKEVRIETLEDIEGLKSSLKKLHENGFTRVFITTPASFGLPNGRFDASCPLPYDYREEQVSSWTFGGMKLMTAKFTHSIVALALHWGIPLAKDNGFSYVLRRPHLMPRVRIVKLTKEKMTSLFRPNLERKIFSSTAPVDLETIGMLGIGGGWGLLVHSETFDEVDVDTPIPFISFEREESSVSEEVAELQSKVAELQSGNEVLQALAVVQEDIEDIKEFLSFKMLKDDIEEMEVEANDEPAYSFEENCHHVLVVTSKQIENLRPILAGRRFLEMFVTNSHYPAFSSMVGEKVVVALMVSRNHDETNSWVLFRINPNDYKVLRTGKISFHEACAKSHKTALIKHDLVRGDTEITNISTDSACTVIDIEAKPVSIPLLCRDEEHELLKILSSSQDKKMEVEPNDS